jgi:signal peptidase II
MRERSYLWLLCVFAVLGLVADQATKYGVFAWLSKVEGHCYAVFQTEPVTRTLQTVPAENDPFARLKQRGFFLEVAFEPRTSPDEPLRPHVNHGALFGFLRNYTTGANLLFMAISLVAAVAIAVWGVQPGTRKDGWLCASLGLILAGTLGNLYDRVLFNGVRDFLHWNLWFDWPVFNVADCCLVVGAGMLLMQAFVPQPKPEEKPEQKEEPRRKVLNVGSIVSNEVA